MTGRLDVYLEVGQKRVFACALDWPGWCRAGKTEDAALDALVASAPRYALVAQEAGLAFSDMQRDAIHVVARLEGSASYTDFGVPGAILASDRKPWSEAEAARQIALVRAAWTVFNRVAALTPADLRKGPRGGGRDRDKVIDHVLGAEVAYARKLGVKHLQPARDDTEAIMAIRDTWPAGAYDPAAAGGRVNAPPGTLGIHEGMEVESSDGHRVGTVDALDIDLATGDIQGFVVKHGFLFTRDTRIPAGDVQAIRDGKVILKLTKDQVQQVEQAQSQSKG